MSGSSDWLTESVEPLIDGIELDERKRDFIRRRWLEQVVWMENKAAVAKRRYFQLRMTTVVGAVMIPALVSLDFSNGDLDSAARIATWVVSLLVAVSAAVEQLFHYGATWRNYRQTVERLKAEGWQYFQLIGDYGVDGATYDSAYRAFAMRVEELIRTDVEVYLTEVAVEQEPAKQPPGPTA
jgi:hypothetical protein